MKRLFACVILCILCLSAYITVSARTTDIVFLESSGLSVEDDAYIIGIPEKSLVSDLKDHLINPADVYVKDGDGILQGAGNFVGTGYQVAVIQHHVINKALTVIVKGDVSGDGRVTSADYLNVKKEFSGSGLLSGLFREAADINGDGKLLSSDYLQIKGHFKGTNSLYAPLPAVTAAAPTPTANPNSMGNTVEYANQVKNQPQAYYTDSSRTAYLLKNAKMELIQGLVGSGAKSIQVFRNPDGGVYFTDTMDAFFEAPRKERAYFSDGKDATSQSSQVSLRHGFYYFETHFRNTDFSGYSHLLDLAYNVLPETLHINYELEYKAGYKESTALGVETKIEKSTVRALEVADANGIHSSLSGLDPATVEYAAFDIEKAGVVGIIYPTDSLCTRITVTEEGTCYVVRSIIDVPETVAGTKYNLNVQLYNDQTHSFEGVEEAAYIERHPVSVTVTDTTNSEASYVGYDSATGLYRVKEINDWYNFNTAYYTEPNYYMYAGLSIQNDGHERPIYFWINSNVECMECASLLDGNGKLVAVPMEVCKNFGGEHEEMIYDPDDTAYGDTFFPVYLTPGEEVSCTAVQYIQNWGKYALQQISSIQFFATYYHMSTGATETTCIAPLGVYGKDGYILPDFRGCSGKMWSNQPQFNSTGETHFTSVVNRDLSVTQTEYVGSDLLCTGPIYGEMKYSYLSDDGAYRYTMTHLEFPQNDESRNYYTYELEFLQDYTCKNVFKYFRIVDYNCHNKIAKDCYKQYAYLDADGNEVVADNVASDKSFALAKGSSFVTFYDLNASQGNFGLIIQDYEVTVDGELWDGNLGVVIKRKEFDDTVSNQMILTLADREIHFKKGDTIKIHMILLPYGKTKAKTYDNVKRVFEDSALHPISVSPAVGTVTEHPYMALIRAENNRAQFAVSGSRNLNAIRIDGFTGDAKPTLEELVDGEWIVYDNSVLEFDGYGAHYNEDNTYGFSYVVDMGEEGAARTFRIRQ